MRRILIFIQVLFLSACVGHWGDAVELGLRNQGQCDLKVNLKYTDGVEKSLILPAGRSLLLRPRGGCNIYGFEVSSLSGLIYYNYVLGVKLRARSLRWVILGCERAFVESNE